MPLQMLLCKKMAKQICCIHFQGSWKNGPRQAETSFLFQDKLLMLKTLKAQSCFIKDLHLEGFTFVYLGGFRVILLKHALFSIGR